MGILLNSERRYQVFISSTFLDLEQERQEVIQALLELDCFPAGMELFPASNDERWDLIRKVIDDSDYYLVIIGGRYGSVDDEGVSYTEKEYDYAVGARKPVLGFVHADPSDLPSRHVEATEAGREKLITFRAKVTQRMCKKYRSPEELGSVVSRSLVKLIRSEPATGWVRGDAAMSADVLIELSDLRRKVMEEEASRLSWGATPEGIGELLQGGDHLDIDVSCDVKMEFSDYDDEGNEYDEVTYAYTVRLEWDDLFRAVGPSLMDEASEADMNSRIADSLEDRVQTEHRPDGRIIGLSLPPRTFEIVKVQLVALGLVTPSKRKHPIGDRKTYWSLSPFGMRHLMELQALRRPNAT